MGNSGSKSCNQPKALPVELVLISKTARDYGIIQGENIHQNGGKHKSHDQPRSPVLVQFPGAEFYFGGAIYFCRIFVIFVLLGHDFSLYPGVEWAYSKKLPWIIHAMEIRSTNAF